MRRPESDYSLLLQYLLVEGIGKNREKYKCFYAVNVKVRWKKGEGRALTFTIFFDRRRRQKGGREGTRILSEGERRKKG